MAALDVAKQSKAVCVGLTNVMYSSLAKRVDFVIPVCAGREVAVASTKAYTCQLSALYLFAHALQSLESLEINYKEIETLSKNMLNFDFNKIDVLAEKLKDKKEVVFIGKDIDYVTAMEASLKLKEVSYINTACYPSGELKHGYLAVIEKETPLIVFANQKEIKIKSINAAHEAISRGAESIIITNETGENLENMEKILICEESEMLSAIMAIVPMQYLAYKISVLKGLNPDKPRNLAKSVTVE